MIRRIGLMLLLGLLIVWPVPAQERHGTRMGLPAPEFERLSEAETIRIPFEVANNHLLIPLSIDGERFRVILDTGMPTSGLMLYGTERVDDLGLNYGDMRVRVGGAGKSSLAMEAKVATGATLEIAGLRMKNTHIIVIPPIHGFRDYHDGVIGAALFNNFVVEIDYDESVVTLHDQKTYQPAEGLAEQKIDLRNRFPYTELKVTTAEGVELAIEVVVDLGASHALSLNTESDDRIDIPENAIYTVVGKGVGGRMTGYVGRVASLEIGGSTFESVVTSFPDSEFQSPGGLNSKDGNLGNDVLQRFNVTFDYANERMLLEPSRRFEKPFDYNMSGMWIESEEKGRLQVQQLVPESPAAEAGLEVGDLLTHVNGRPVTSRDLTRIVEMLRKEGAELSVELTRDDDSIEAKIKLRPLV